MNSLRIRLTLSLLLGGLLLLGGAGLIFQWRMRRALTREFDEGLKLSAQSLQAFIEEKDHGLKMDSDVDDMPQFSRTRGDTIFLLRTAGGKEVRRSHSLGDQSLPPVRISGDRSRAFETTLADGRELRCLATAFDVDSPHSPQPDQALLIVGRLREPLEHTLEGLRISLLLSGGVTLAALTALVLWGVRHGLRPLERLGREISGVNAASLSTRFPVGPLPAELRPITLRLNELLGRLEAVFEREKRFTANVAHELRTPLAELRTLAEVNLLAPPESAGENLACWHDVSAISGRMESLALRLLELARSEQGRQTIHREPLRPAGRIAEICKRFSSQSIARGILCENSIPAELEWQSDPVLLDLIFTNLIGNAVQHAPADSVLHIRWDGVALHFSNEAPELQKEDLPDLFERFWKKDASRSDGRRHGLGLALARETAELLGGTLDARLTDGSVLEFVLQLPAEIPVPEGAR